MTDATVPQPPLQRFTRRDAAFLAICLALAAVAVVVIVRYFSSAFPEASIDFRYDRGSSRTIAEKFLAQQGVATKGMKHAVRFDTDDQASIFLERTLGLDRARRVLKNDVRVWSWHHRWFQPLVEEELSVDVAPTGEIVGYTHKLPEDRAANGARPPLPFLQSIGVKTADLTLVSTSERRLPKRIQRIYTFESKTLHPGGAPYRHRVVIDGDVVTEYASGVKVPESWLRSYRELRSKNSAAGSVDMIFLVATMIAAVVVFIVRLRRGDLRVKFLLAIGAATIVLVGGVSLNSLPAQLAWYDTSTSYPAFLAQMLFGAAIQSIGTAMMLIVICGAGEVLYRERLPQHLAIPRLWTPKALTSKRVFLGMVLGYALVPLFIGYQVVFYVVAQRFGAWAPAEVPYDEMLNTAFPWVAVLFAGFFPAFSEEFLSRAFSIPFLQRIVRSRLFAIVLAGFIWGFGHSTYPNQPFWIRGVEVGIAGVVAGLLMDRFGLLPLLVWHYTIDAVYTATLLFASGNTYYIVSAAASSLVFAVPLIVSLVLYVRNRGFLPDEDLTNAAIPVVARTREVAARGEADLPTADARGLSPLRIALCVALVAAAALAIAFRPSSPQDAIDYRIKETQAKAIAKTQVRGTFAHVIAIPVEGFRSWDSESPREEGGTPGDFDSIAATYLMQHGASVERVIAIFRSEIEAGTWMVRFFSPMQKEEIFVEVDPRTSRVVGYHKYQDEARPAPSLPRDQALAIARSSFPRFGVNPDAFEVKEELTFAQPKRRDWLFHFEERKPLAASAYRRVTVRVAGAEVTQFHKTVKIPESVVREANTQTLLNVIFLVLRILGSVALLALVIAGLIIASRRHGLPWRRPLRWTLVLAIIPIAALAARFESMLSSYSTSIAWETFRVSLWTRMIAEAGLQIGVIFLALAGAEAAMPYALNLLSREGRARFGRAAVVAALTAVAVFVLVDVGSRVLARAMPSAAVVEVSAPSEVATPLPGLIEGGRGLVMAVVVAGVIALFSVTLRRYGAAITIAAVFFAMLDPSATPAQTPLMLVRALLLAGLIWVVGRYVLSASPLAWPLFAFLAASLQTIGVLLSQHRPDLFANAVGLIVLVALTLGWMWRTHARVV